MTMMAIILPRDGFLQGRAITVAGGLGEGARVGLGDDILLGVGFGGEMLARFGLQTSGDLPGVSCRGAVALDVETLLHSSPPHFFAGL